MKKRRSICIPLILLTGMLVGCETSGMLEETENLPSLQLEPNTAQMPECGPISL